MKKILASLAIVLSGVCLTYGQGTVAIYSTGGAPYAISTNGVTTGVTAGAGNYMYALLIATYGGAAPSSNPLDSAWTFSGAYATNYLNNGGIRAAGASTGFAVTGWPLANGTYLASTPEYYMIVGWSTTLGTTWSAVSSQLQNGWSSSGYFGASAVAYQVGGNPGQSLNAVNLLGNPASYNGAGLSSGWVLNAVSPSVVPEPSTMALAALGGASMLLFRRRK